MGVLESVKAMFEKDGEARKNAEAVLAMLGDRAQGGLKGLGDVMERLRHSEIAEQAGSWVSTNANRVITPEQVQKVFGAEAVGRAADRLGVTAKEASERMAAALPQVIDNLSPTGKLPENLDAIGKELGGLLKTPRGKAIAGAAAAGVAVAAGVAAAVAARSRARKAAKAAAAPEKDPEKSSETSSEAATKSAATKSKASKASPGPKTGKTAKPEGVKAAKAKKQSTPKTAKPKAAKPTKPSKAAKPKA